jgi:sulfopyruvate decarboxylase alpha subunit
MPRKKPAATYDWPLEIHRTLRANAVRQVSYVPDAGHKRLIELCHRDRRMTVVALTTEEEGIAVAAGAWLGGERSALLMQSSGVGNCVNMLTLATHCAFPLVMLVTMRGEWGEFNPWQVPMGQATQDTLERSGVRTFRLERPEETGATVDAAARLTWNTNAMTAVLIAQRMIGTKTFETVEERR